MDMSATLWARPRSTRMDLVAGAPPFAEWPSPDAESIERLGGATLFARRRRAVVMWCELAKEMDIRHETRLSIAEARNIAKRCLQYNPQTKSIYGFWPCLPGYRTGAKTRVRQADFKLELVEQSRGLNGALGSVFRRYPHMEQELLRVLKTRRPDPNGPQSPLMGAEMLHGLFIDMCRKVGLEDRGEWPFQTQRLGREAIRVWFKKACAQHPTTASDSVYGEEVGSADRRSTAFAMSEPNADPLWAYEVVQTDEHRLDAMFTAVVTLPGGAIVKLPPVRPWLLALVECSSSAILACRLCFRSSFNAEDLNALLLDALDTPPKLTLTLGGEKFRYSEDAALPGERAELRGKLWKMLALDGHASHLSDAVKKSLNSVMRCDVDNGPPATPQLRAHIESFFSGVADWMAMLPTAVGNKPGSPVRREPEKAAVTHAVSLRHAQEIVDVYCRNFNATPSRALGGYSPLQVLERKLVQKQVYLGKAGDFGPSRLWRLLPCHRATVTRLRGPSSLSALVVRLKDAVYSGPTLAQHARLGYASEEERQVSVYVHEDARRAKVVPDAFPDEVHDVVAHGPFSSMAMTLPMRQLVSSYARRRGVRGRVDRVQLALGVYQSLALNAASVPAGANLLRHDLANLVGLSLDGPRHFEDDTNIEDLRACMDGLDLEEVAEEGADAEEQPAAQSSIVRTPTPTPAPPPPVESAAPVGPAEDDNDLLGLL